MKLTKGKKQEEKEKKKPAEKPASIPKPPEPVRIQVEPRKASTVSLEVKSETKPKAKKGKPVKSVEISTSQHKKPSVTVSIFDSAAPAPARQKSRKSRQPKPILLKRQKIEMETDKIPLISKPSRIKAYEKPSSVRISDSSGKITEGDLKFIRDFIAKSGYLDNQVAEVRIGLSKIAKLMDMFTEKVNSAQKDVGELKIKMASLKEWKIEKDVSELKERTDEMEVILEKMSEKFKEYKVESDKSNSMDSKKMKSATEEISGLKDGMKDIRERIASLNTELTKLGDFKAFVQAKAQEPSKEAAPDVIKNVSDRLDTADSRIAGITERIVRLSEDTQKLTSYFMEGIKHVESRIRVIESERETKEQITRIPEPEPKFTPTTYRSHLKSELPAEQEIPQMTTTEEVDIDADMDIDEEEYEGPRRRFTPTGSKVLMPQPPPAPLAFPRPTPSRDNFGRDYSQQPSRAPSTERPPSITGSPPPAPAPERGNMFTKLRESTVIRRPIQQIDPDLDILLEHIRESIQKQESREKITRDLLNTGFDQDLISKAFLRYRVG